MAFDVKITGYRLAATIELNNHSQASIRKGWRPRVANKKRSMLGGGGPYSEVAESVPISIRAADEEDCLEYLADIAGALEQAEQWRLSGGASNEATAVLFNYQAFDGAGTYQAAITGAGNARELLQLTAKFNEDLNAYEIEATLKFTRRGFWLRTVTETAVTSFAEDNPIPLRVTFTGKSPEFPSANYPHYLPTILQIENTDYATYDGGDDGAKGYLIVTDDEDDIVINAPNTKVVSGSYGYAGMSVSTTIEGVTSTTTAANQSNSTAYTGLVKAITPNDANNPISLYGSDVTTKRSRVRAVFACVYNESSTITYELKAYLRTGGNTVNIVPAYKGRPVYIPPGEGPVVKFIGMGTMPDYTGETGILILPSATGGSSDQLLVNYLLWVEVNEATRILSVENILPVGGGRRYIHLHPRDVLSVNPTFHEYTLADDTGLSDGNNLRYTIPYRGIPYPLSRGDSMAVCLAGVSNNVPNAWMIGNSTANPLNLQLKATRQIGFLTPRE